MQVRFYQPENRFADDPQACLLGLVSQCFERGERVAWLVDDSAAAALVERRLWETPADSFIPHQIAGQDDDRACPVLILPSPQAPEARPVVINQRGEAVTTPVERVLELIPADPTGQQQARQRWRAYQARGIKPELVRL